MRHVCATQNIARDIIPLKASQLAHEDVSRQIRAHYGAEEEEARRKRQREADDEEEIETRRLRRDAKRLELLPPAKDRQLKQIEIQNARQASQMHALVVKAVSSWRKCDYTITELREMFTRQFPTLSHQQFIRDPVAAVPGGGDGVVVGVPPAPAFSSVGRNHATGSVTRKGRGAPKPKMPTATTAPKGMTGVTVTTPSTPPVRDATSTVVVSPSPPTGTKINPFFLSPQDHRDQLYGATMAHRHRETCGDDDRRACLFQLGPQQMMTTTTTTTSSGHPAGNNNTLREVVCDGITRIGRLLASTPNLRPDIVTEGVTGNWFIPTDLIPIMKRELLGIQPTQLCSMGDTIGLPVPDANPSEPQPSAAVLRARKAVGRNCKLTSVVTLHELLSLLDPCTTTHLDAAAGTGGGVRHGAALALVNAHIKVFGAVPQKRLTVNVYPCSHMGEWCDVLARFCGGVQRSVLM
jgi:hypothetical protein